MYTQLATTQLNSVDRNAMILEYYPLVKAIAFRLVSRFPSNIDVDDLINIGTLGLIDAIDRYRPERQESFKAYAELRIRGAIIDALREQDWVPRSQRQRAHDLEKASRKLSSELGRTPTDQEVADHLKVPLAEYREMSRNSTLMSVVSLDDLGVGDDSKRDILEVLQGEGDDPDSLFEARNATATLAEAIRSLPQKEKVVVSLYYYEDLTLKEIGQVLSVTESRVSQIHTKAVEHLKLKLKKLSAN